MICSSNQGDKMSLVDYASSSDEDDDVLVDRQEKVKQQLPKHEPSPSTIPHNNQKSGSISNRQPEIAAQSTAPSMEKLPDASLLLNSPTNLSSSSSSSVSGSDHASRVSSALRKRDSNGLSSSLPRTKLPRGNLPHTKNVPDTVGRLLVPPQLTGRSNIVTEDIGKLFVKRHAHTESSSH